MNLLMISGDRSIVAGRKGAFWNTLMALQQHFDRIDVICPRPAKRDDSLLPALMDVSVVMHSAPGGLLQQRRWIAEEGAKLIAQHGHAVIAAHEYPPFYNGRGALALGRQMGVPVVLEVHHLVGWPRPAGVAEAIGAVASAVCLPLEIRRCAGVRVVNSTVKSQLESLGVLASKVTVVPSFYLDTSTLQPRSVSGRYDLVTCARLVQNKGLYPLLDAVARLPGVTLGIVGDGPLRQAMERYAERLSIADRVDFLGWLDDQQAVADAMRSGRLFVMNSKSEGGPRVALEAMACGVPVVATRVGVMPDVIQNGVNGFFSDGTADGLVELLQELLSDQERIAAAGKQACAITERFERSALIREYAEFLQSFAL